MSAVRREQPVRLPTERGGVAGALVTEASDEQLQACLAQDRRWLYGGEVVVDDETRQVVGFLSDASQNPGKYETAEEYLAHTPEKSVNHRSVHRVAVRVAAVEAELAKRAEEQHDENVRRREQARAKLVAWREEVPKVVAEFQRSAELVARAWQMVSPIADALGYLQRRYPSAQADIRAQYARLQAHHQEVAQALDPKGDYQPLPDLPLGLPSFEQVLRVVNEFNTTTLEWPDSRVPATGLEKINLARTLRDAGG